MKYAVMYGRFVTFHDGHKYLMKKVYEETGCPLKIMVRDTDEEPCALDRCKTISAWLQEENIEGRVQGCEDIVGVYYGRGVGYEVKEIEVPKKVAEISGTKIREQRSEQ